MEGRAEEVKTAFQSRMRSTRAARTGEEGYCATGKNIHHPTLSDSGRKMSGLPFCILYVTINAARRIFKLGRNKLGKLILHE